MTRIERLKAGVDELYMSKNLGREDWADWLYANHVFVVADFAGQVAEKVGARKELAMAAGMLHDVADAVMSRDNPDHVEESARISRRLLLQSGFSEDESSVVVDDALKFHGCRNGRVPLTLEGKAMATADALAHLKTGFYDFALGEKRKVEAMDDIRNWARPKIERDFRDKIFFDDLREGVRLDYERCKALFG